ncbi:MAG TPA: DUF167 domain-containing protein [Thermoanaerobaculia bacterium]|nr:DUF167 domain-containing protein [Thermoanaerobaculia bacterium]
MNAPAVPGDLELKPDGSGSRLRLRVSAGASRPGLSGVHGGALKLAVAAPPEKGKANRAVVRLVADAFGLGPRDVEIVAGETSPDKVVYLPLAPEEATRRWAALAGR